MTAMGGKQTSKTLDILKVLTAANGQNQPLGAQGVRPVRLFS